MYMKYLLNQQRSRKYKTVFHVSCGLMYLKISSTPKSHGAMYYQVELALLRPWSRDSHLRLQWRHPVNQHCLFSQGPYISQLSHC